MGLFKSLGSVTGGVFKSVGQGISNATGLDLPGVMSGIPFIGEGFAAEKQNQFAAAQSAQQMAYQTEMSNTAHQRQAKDLEKAGLNRILSMGGSGASSPSGSAASGSALSGAGHSADFLKSIYKKEGALANENLKATAANTKLTAAKEKSEEVNQIAGANSAKESAQRTEESKTRQQNLKLQQEGLKQDAQFEKEHGGLLRKSNAILNSAQKVKDVINPFKGLFNGKQTPQRGKKTVIDGNSGEILNEYY